MTIKAWLEGDDVDLRALTRLLAEGDVRVVQDPNEGAYYLTAPEIDNPTEPGRFDQGAEPLIRRINGVARVQDSGYRPVKLSRRYTDPDGQNVHFAAVRLEARASLTVTAAVVGPDGQPKPNPPSPWPGRLAIAESNADLAEVLDIMGQPEPLGWDDLYKVHEIIWRSMEDTTPVKLGWTTSNRDSAFTNSANNPTISGAGARHARPPKGDQSKRKMTIDEGRNYISDLIAKWLDALS